MTTPATTAPVAVAAPPAPAGTALTVAATAPVAPAAVATPPPGEAAAAGAPEVPAPYELALPEGFEAGVELDAFKAEALKHKVPAEAASAFLSMHAKAVQAQAEAREQEIAGWVKALPTDKVVGGPQYEANKQVAFKAAARFANADPEVKAWLESTGLGNHPLMARILFGVGKAMGEDSVAGLTGGAPQTKTPDASLRERYPSMFKE